MVLGLRGDLNLILLKSRSKRFSLCSRTEGLASLQAAVLREQPRGPELRTEKPGLQAALEQVPGNLPTPGCCVSNLRERPSRRGKLTVILWSFQVMQMCRKTAFDGEGGERAGGCCVHAEQGGALPTRI